MRSAKLAGVLLCWGASLNVQAGIPSLEWNIGWSVPNGGEDQFLAAAQDAAGATWVLTKQERSDGNGGPGSSEYWSLLRYSAAGTLTATRYLPDTDGNTPDLQAMTVDGAGVVYVGGYRWGDNGRADLYLARYPAGAATPDWEQVAGTFNQRWSALELKLDGLGNLYVAGQAITDGSGNNRDALVLKYTTAGVQQWSSSVNLGNRDVGYGVAIDGAGDVWLAGMTDLNFDLRPFVRKLDAAGTVLLTRTITRAAQINYDAGAAVAWSADDGLVAIAHGGSAIGVLKLDPATGDTVWSGATPGGFTGYDVGGIAVTTSGSVYVAARFNNNGWSDLALATFSATLAITTESGTVVYDSGLEDGCCTTTEAPLAKVRVGVIGGTDAVIALGATGRCALGTGASSDLFVRRYTGGDTPAWTASYDGPAQQQVAGAAADPDGNVYVSVRSGRLPVIRKYDRAGALVWSRSFTSTVFCDPSADGITAGPGGVTLAVTARLSTTFCCQSLNAAVFQTWDAAGVPGTRVSVALPQTNNSDEDFRKVTYDPAGNLYAAGDLSLFNGTGSGALRALKFSPAGDLLWNRTLTMPGAGEVELIQASADAAGNLWLAATVRYGSGGGGDDPAEGWMAKYSPNGTLLWARSFTGINQMGGIAAPLSDGYAAGFQFGQSGISAYFLRLDAAGNEIWRRQYTGGAQPLTVFFGGVAADASGNVFASGIAGSLGPKAPQEEDFILDYLLLSYDADGQLRWAETFDTGTPEDFPSAVTLWPGFTTGRVFVAGGNGAGPNLLLYEEPYAELRAALAADPPAMTPGSWVTVSLTVTNVGTIDAESVLPAIVPVSGGVLVSAIDGPLPAGPVTIGPLTAQTFVWTYSANGLGVVRFSATGAGVESGTLSPRSAAASLDVAAGARLAGALWLDPDPPAATVPGTTFTASLTVTNTGTNTANLVTPFSQVNLAGPATLIAGPMPAGPLPLASGAGVTFIWTYSVTGAGAVSFTFTAQGTDAIGGTPVALAATLSGPVGYGLATLDAALEAGDVFVGQPLTVSLGVMNSGSASTTMMTPSISIATGASRVAYLSGPGPSAPIFLPAGSATVVEWTYATLQPGPVAFTVSTGGLQPGTGAPLTASAGDLADLLGPALQSWVQFWPMMPVVGEVVEVRYQVNNLSGTVIDAVLPAATAFLGSTLVRWEAGVAPATAQLQPWSSTLFIWSFSTTGAGDTGWSLTAAGVATSNGIPVTTAATGFMQIRPGTALLAGWLGSPTSSSPLTGSAFDMIFSVANVGGTAATVYAPMLDVTQGAGLVTPAGAPVPAGPVHLDPGMSQMFVWTFTTMGAGAVSFSATANGEEVGTWVPLTATATATLNATARTAPLSASFTLIPGAPVAGQMFQVWLNLQNAGNSTATALIPSLALSPPAGIGLYDSGPNPPGPLILSPGQGTVVKWTYSTTGPGILTLTATASGLVADTAIPSSGTITGTIQVRAPAALTAAVAAFPSPRVAGQSFLVTLTVTNTGESDAALTASAPLAVTGGGAAAPVAGPTPGQPVSLAGGAALTFTWTYTAGSAGAVTLSTTVTAEESVFGTPISTGPVAASPLTVLSQAALVSALAVTPAFQVLNQVVTVSLTVTNTGDTGATGVTATVHASSGGAFVALRSGPAPATPQAIASLGSQTFVWTFSVTGAGSVSFTATAAGTDVVMATPKFTQASAGLTTVAGSFLDTTLAFGPAGPSIGTWFQINLSVSNTGAVDANLVSPYLSVNTNPAFVALISAPAGPLTLVPGGSTVFAWTYSVSGAGAVEFTATAVGQDSVGLYDLVSAKTAVLNTKTPAALDAALSFSPGTQSVGTQVQLRLTVTNTGGAAAAGLVPMPLPQFWGGASTLTYVAGPVPANLSLLAAGGTTTFVWTYTVANAGTPSLTLSVTGTDAGTGAPLEDGDVRSLTTFNAAALAAGWTFIPPSPAVGQWFTARLTVTNTGGVNAVTVTPFLQSNLGSGLVSLESTAAPPNTPAIAPGASQTFVWTFSSSGAGLVEFTGTPLGRDLGTAAVISAPTTAQLTILTAANLVGATSYTPAILSAGMGFRLRLTVTNAGQAAATNVLPAVQLLNHGTATVTVWGGPTPATVPTLAGLGAQMFEWSASATAPGSLIVTLTVTGENSNLYPILARGTVVANVLPAAALSGAFSMQSDSAQPSVGTWIRVRLTVTNTGGVAANTVTPFLDANLGGALATQIAAPVPLPTLAAGAMTTFEWTYSVSGAGSVAFTLTAHGRDENTASLLQATATGGLTTLAASQLSVGLVMSSTFPSVGQWMSVRLQVTNTGGVPAVNLVPSRQIHSGFGFLSDELGPVPTGLSTLAAGGTTAFVWTYTVAGAGTVNFTGSVTASDSGTGTATRWGDNRLFTTLLPASLASWLSITPASPSVGQLTTIALTVTNTGQVHANGVTPTSLLSENIGGALFNIESPASPPGPVVIQPGQAQTFQWSYSPVGTGTIEVTGSATGADSGVGTALLTAGTGSLVAVLPAGLKGAASFATLPVSEGMTFPVRLTVTNTGQSPASNVTPFISINVNPGLSLVGSAPVAMPLLLAGASTTFEWVYTATGFGPVSFTMTAIGTDLNAGYTRTAGGTAATTILGGALLGGYASLSSTSTSVGTWFEIRLTVTNVGGGATALSVSPYIAITSGAPLVAAISAPVLLPSLAAGAATTFAWTYSVSGSGPIVFSLTAAGTDAGSFALLTATQTGTAAMLTASNLQLAFAASSTIPSVGQSVSITLTVTNTGGVHSHNVLPDLTILSGAANLTGASGPVPAGPLSLAPGASQGFVYTATVANAGAVSLTGSVSGSDAGTNAATTRNAGLTLITVPAASLGAYVSLSNTAPSEGQTFQITLTVTNSGGVAANSVTPAALQFHVASATAVAYVSGPVPASVASLNPGAQTTFVWNYTAAGAGPFSFTTSITGTDSGSLSATTSRDARAITIFRSGRLRPSLAFATSYRSVGQTVQVHMTVTNTGDQPVLNPAPFIDLNLGGATQVDAPTGIAQLDPAQSIVFTWTYTANAAGPISWTVTAIGTEAVTGATIVRAAAGGFNVIAAATLSATATVSPAIPSIGQTVQYRVRVMNVGGVTANNVTAGTLDLSGTGLSLLASPVSPVNISPLGNVTFTWTLTAIAGVVTNLTATPTGVDANTTAGLSAAASLTVTTLMDAQLAGSLAVTPTVIPASVGQYVTIALTVTNVGGVNATGVAPLLQVNTGTASLEAVSGPIPATPQTITPGSAVTFVWTRSISAAMTYNLTATAFGTDSGTSGQRLGVGTTSFAAVSGAQLLAGLVVTPSTVSVGQQVQVRLTVNNTGQTAANNVTPSLSVGPGSGAVSQVGVTPPALGSLASGSFVVFTWTFTADSSAAVTFTATASGIDAGSGALRASSAISTLTSQAAASLIARVDVTPNPLNVGQNMTVVLSVTNTGQATANSVAPLLGLISSTTTFAWSSIQTGPLPAGSANISGGGSAYFTWTYKADIQGSHQFTFTVSGTDVNSSATVTRMLHSTNVAVTAIAVLTSSAAVSQNAARAGEIVEVRLTVANVGANAADNVTPALSSSNASLYSIASGPTPASIGSLSAPGNATFTWRLMLKGSGTLSLNLSADGVNNGSLAPVSTPSAVVSIEVQGGVQIEPNSLVIAPNLLDLTTGSGSITLHLRGEGSAKTEVRIYDSAGQYVRSIEVALDSTGAAAFRFDGLDASGQPLPSGAYWALPVGGGVEGKVAFMVKARKK